MTSCKRLSTSPEAFREYMRILHEEEFNVIAMRDLAKYVDPTKRPNAEHPYAPIRERVEKLKKERAGAQ